MRVWSLVLSEANTKKEIPEKYVFTQTCDLTLHQYAVLFQRSNRGHYSMEAPNVCPSGPDGIYAGKTGSRVLTFGKGEQIRLLL